MRDTSLQFGKDENGNCLCQICRDGRYFRDIKKQKDFNKVVEFAESVYNDWLNDTEDLTFQVLALDYIKDKYPEIYREAHKHKWEGYNKEIN